MTPDVKAYIDALIQREGPYVNHPADKGGPTTWGLTETTARAYGYTGAMPDLPMTFAGEVYEKRYWHEPRFDELDDIDAQLAVKLFDIGVNYGQAMGVLWLQRALNVLNQEGKLWPDLKRDGRLGTMTFYALKTFLAQRGDAGRQVLHDMIEAQQSVRYIELAEAKASQEEFEYGWQRRASAV
jgi:lysozyme family protein